VGGVCSMHGRNVYNVLVGRNLNEGDHLEDLGIDGKVIFE